MSASEKIKVVLGISGTYWDKRPEYRVSMNDTVIKQDFVTADSDVVEQIEFEFEYTTSEATLKVELLNKLPADTVENEDKTGILKDLLLNIKTIHVDDIDLGHLPYNMGKYKTLVPVDYKGEITDTIPQCVNLRWNGAWTLTWTNPFYIWLLENL